MLPPNAAADTAMDNAAAIVWADPVGYFALGLEQWQSSLIASGVSPDVAYQAACSLLQQNCCLPYSTAVGLVQAANQGNAAITEQLCPLYLKQLAVSQEAMATVEQPGGLTGAQEAPDGFPFSSAADGIPPAAAAPAAAGAPAAPARAGTTAAAAAAGTASGAARARSTTGTAAAGAQKRGRGSQQSAAGPPGKRPRKASKKSGSAASSQAGAIQAGRGPLSSIQVATAPCRPRGKNKIALQQQRQQSSAATAAAGAGAPAAGAAATAAAGEQQRPSAATAAGNDLAAAAAAVPRPATHARPTPARADDRKLQRRWEGSSSSRGVRTRRVRVRRVSWPTTPDLVSSARGVALGAMNPGVLPTRWA